MKIESAKINNYKSIGEENNLICFSDTTCIIGKNESGKTNILEALSEIKFNGFTSDNYFRKKNRINDRDITLSFLLKPYKSEKEKYKKLADTKVFIDNSAVHIEGGISDVILNDKELINARDKFISLVQGVNFGFDENARKEFDIFKNRLSNIDKIVLRVNTYIDNIKNGINRSPATTKVEIIEIIDFCVNRLKEIYLLFPNMFLIDSNSLKTEYKRDEIKTPKDEITKINIKMLNMFLQVAGIDYDLIEKYWTITNSGEKKDLIESFDKLIENNISSKFNNFYKQNDVSCSILLDNNTLSISIKTDGKNMEFSERSNGLKWYFNTFIKMLYSNLTQNNVVYLLDEPGVFLHVNAQKELLNFFKDLSSKENQVIYTTHSPYMINQEDMGAIRLVAKENSLFTSISNSYNSFPSDASYGTQETLTPLLYAIGLDLKYNIGPDSKKINVVVEGISDYYYLNAFITLKNKKYSNIYIIPSVGCSQINKVVSILIGWGYEYRVLFDNDKDGRKEYKKLIEMLDVSIDNITFTDGTKKITDLNLTHEIENVFSSADYIKIVNNTPNYEDKKKIVALDIYNKAKNGENVFDDETLQNLDLLINKIISKVN